MKKLMVFILVFGLSIPQAFADMDVDKDLESYLRIWQCPADTHICDSYEECYKIISDYEGRYIMACSKEAIAIRSIGRYMKHFEEVVLLLMDRIDLYEGGRELGSIIDPSEEAYRKDTDSWPVRYVFNRYLEDHWKSYGKNLPEKEYIDIMTPLWLVILSTTSKVTNLNMGFFQVHSRETITAED